MKLYRIEMPIMSVYILVTFRLWTGTQIFKRELGKEIQYKVTRKINRCTKFRWPTFHLIIWDFSSIDTELNFLLIMDFKILLNLHEWINEWKTGSSLFNLAKCEKQTARLVWWQIRAKSLNSGATSFTNDRDFRQICDHDERLCRLLFRFTARR